MNNARVIIDKSTPMPSAEKLAKIKDLWAQQKAQDEAEGRNRLVIFPTGEVPNNRRFTVINLGKRGGKTKALSLRLEGPDAKSVTINDKEYRLTDPFDFKLKPVTLAVHQALAFYEVWNRINKEPQNAH